MVGHLLNGHTTEEPNVALEEVQIKSRNVVPGPVLQC